MCREVTIKYGQCLRESVESGEKISWKFLYDYKVALKDLATYENVHLKKLAVHFIINAIAKKSIDKNEIIYNKVLCKQLLPELNLLRKDKTLDNFFENRKRLDFCKRVTKIAETEEYNTVYTF